MDLLGLKQALSQAKGEIKICGHANPDADSILASILLCDLFTFLGVRCRVSIPEHITAEQPTTLARLLSIDLCTLYGEISDTDDVFLVDCHDSQFGGRVLGCIDHHPTKNRIDLPFCMNKRATSATMMVMRLMEESGMECTAKHYTYAVYSAYLDTLSLKSPKTDKRDIPWLDEKIAELGIDKDFITRLGLGINDQGRPVCELARIGYKEYDILGNRIATSYLMYAELSEALRREILQHLVGERERTGIGLWIYVFCNPITEHSDICEISADGVTVTSYDRIISRSVDLVPMLEGRYRS